jgi:phenylalanyl-tRNA synthetase beta chain
LALEHIRDILESLEFQCMVVADSDVPNTLHVTVPDHRMDIDTGVTGRADLIEEIARIYGYDRIPDTQFDDVMPPQRDNPALQKEERVRDLLVEAGLQEVITYRLTTPEREALLYPPSSAPSQERPYVTLANPTSAERTSMRHSLVASVLEVVANNARHRERIGVFEIGPVFLPRPDELLPEEPRHLVIAITGPRDPEAWQGTDTSPVDFYDLKGILETLVDGLHLVKTEFEPIQDPSYYPGRVGSLRVDGETIGVLGQLHPLVQEAFDLPEDRPVLVAHIDFEAMSQHIANIHRVSPVPRFPAVRQDIAVIVDESTPAKQVEATILASGGRLLASACLFDVYRGEQIGASKKSLAYTLTFQAEDRTLTDQEVAKVQDRIVSKLEKELGARLRAQAACF